MSNASLQKADELSADAFGAYPCVLAYRNTRALVLVAIGRAAEALEVLAYTPYESASAVERGQREGARALALHRLGKTEQARIAEKAAIELNPTMGGILNTLLTAATKSSDAA